ncbi:MAG: ECF-type sigma factor [Planctomycetota bacterium]|jgi:RNA polymerase sigma factor (TIGR02999 family)
MHSDITIILDAVERGDANASEQLLPLVYDQLRELASSRLKSERNGYTMQATELVHEAYLRLVGPAARSQTNWDGRGHFFAAAAESMRRILIDHARARGAARRGGSWRQINLDLSQISLDEVPAELVDLDEVLTRFQDEDPDKAHLVELRFFAGLTMEQACSVLGISLATGHRHWAYARAWLFSELEGTQKSEIG